ncbi:hypothetical protein KSP40_PGU003416 [Platanthera guangdongensis]|uniref:Uncharacterized protein n=1 Tax=Platanthera guangdongensis TaxID=2320717 RepID=A0ABR2MJG7_9ASPA
MDVERIKKEEERERAPPSVIKKEALSLSASLQEGWQYVKAYFTRQAKRMTAKNEKEASEADLEEAKTQVEATNEAERRKSQLNNQY